MDFNPPQQKRVTHNGVELTICGRLGDAYFDSIEGQFSRNEFLVPLLGHHVAAGSTIIDVGANVGVCTVLAARLVADCTTISLEPSDVYDCLLETIAANHIERNVALNYCAGNFDGEVDFTNARGDSSASHVALGPGGSRIRIVTLDSLVDELGLDRVDFVKIDVEGYEAGVIDGMRRTNRTFEPLVLMEFNSFTLSAYGNVALKAFLLSIVGDFGCFLARQNDQLVKIDDEHGVIGFLHRNMTLNGCVDDIAFTMSEDRRAAFRL